MKTPLRLMRRRSALGAVLGLAMGLIVGACDEPESRATGALLPPRLGSHVVVVSFDALRADALGAYGQARATSPNLDAFARDALLFENAYSVAPKTPTSFAAFFTGRHPARIFRDWRLADVPTLAELFARAGYRTAGFASNPQLATARGFGRGFEHYRVYPAMRDALVIRDALRWLERQGAGPIFLWVHLIDPHSPWLRKRGAEHLYDPDYHGPYEERAAKLLFVRDPIELARVRSLYDGEIYAVDRLFGELIAGLRRFGIYDDALVVATSDHGEEFMEHGHVQHGWLTEENVRIPLIVRHPDLADGGRVAVRVSNLDLMPLLAAAVGLDLPEEVEGRVPAQGTGEREPLVFVANTDSQILAASILDERWKLIAHCGRRRDRELFDLAADPAERNNLAAQMPDRVESLEHELLRRLGVARCDELRMESRGLAETRDLRVDEIEALGALGYLDSGEPAD